MPAPTDHVSAINEQRRRQRQRRTAPVLTPGQRLWCVPIRWWEPDFEGPDRITVIDAGPQWSTGSRDRCSLLVFSHGYGHPVDLVGADLFAQNQHAWQEMAIRSRALQRAERAEIDAWMARYAAAHGLPLA